MDRSNEYNESKCENNLIHEMVPTYHLNHQKSETAIESNNKKFSDSLVKSKKVRVKLICVLPDWKYMVAKTTVEDYLSLFGGVVDQIVNKNHFSSILTTLEREFYEETTKVVEISFQKRKFSYYNKDYFLNQSVIEEIPFTYIGIFYEMDTIFTVIYIPKFHSNVLNYWNQKIKEVQVNILKKTFEGWNIPIEKIIEVNKLYHQRLMRIKSNYSAVSKQVFGFICSKLGDHHHLLEKAGIDFLDENDFYKSDKIWEWTTMNVNHIKSKIKSLFEKVGIQVQSC
jgi:hypothetical protein